MRIYFYIFSFFIIQLYIGSLCALDINIEDAPDKLAKATESLEKARNFITSGSPGKLLAKMGSVLGALGPALMCVSAVLSIITIFLPKEDSPELKAIKEGFEQVNRKLDVITDEIKNLKSIIELNNAKSAYAKYITIINSNFENLADAQSTKTNESYSYFKMKYEKTYGMAHEHLYDAMVGANAQFGFNLISIYKQFANCNPVLISQYCISSIQLINKGLAIEGTYLGLSKFEAKANSQKKVWTEKMKTLSELCTSEVNECEQNWNKYAQVEFEKVYKSAMSGDTKSYATKITDSLNEVVPQRYWLAVAYKDTSGFDEHCYSSYIDHRKIWHQNGYCVTLFSKSKDDRELSTQEFDALKQAIDKKSAQVANIDNCRKVVFVTITEDRYKGEHAKVIWNHMKSAVKGGLLYLIAKNTNPGYAVTGGRLIAQNQGWRCRGNGYLLLHYP